MSIIQQATDFFNGLKSAPQPWNDYWYGWVVVNGLAPLTIKGPSLSPANSAMLSQLQPPYHIGWQDPLGSPCVGYGPDNTPIAFTDCSGFVSWMIQSQSSTVYSALSSQILAISDQTLQNYRKAINRQHQQNWPSAADYAVLGVGGDSPYFQALGGNENLNLSSLEPGDILAWGLEPGGQDTGHVVFVVDTPTKSGDETWSITVIDSSVLTHWHDDRPGITGVGQGTITLQYDEGSSQGPWQINFNIGDPGFQFCSTNYTSALRITA